MPKGNRCSSFEMDFLKELTDELVTNYNYKEMESGVFLVPVPPSWERAFLTVYNNEDDPLTPGFPAARLLYYKKGMGNSPKNTFLLGPAVERPSWATRWARSLVSQIRGITYNGDYEVCIEK